MTRLAWLASTRDLRWRWRRFLIALVGTSLVLGVTLLLSGFREGIDIEARHLLRDLGADAFVVRGGSPGPFTTRALLDASLAGSVARQDGVARADPLVSVRHTIDTAPAVDVYLIGGVPGGLGLPPVRDGRGASSPGETVVDEGTTRRIGDRFLLGGRPFQVVGRITGASAWAGVPAVFVTLPDAQEVVLGGQPAATAILTRWVRSAASTGENSSATGATRSASFSRPSTSSAA